MKREITITKKNPRKGDDGHKVVSVRMKDSTIASLDALSEQTNRSRNELIGMALQFALEHMEIKEIWRSDTLIRQNKL